MPVENGPELDEDRSLGEVSIRIGNGEYPELLRVVLWLKSMEVCGRAAARLAITVDRDSVQRLASGRSFVTRLEQRGTSAQARTTTRTLEVM